MSIKVSGLTKIYDTQRAVDNISFELKKGEIVGFLGPNGAGKSTTMKIITTYLPATSGQVEVCGIHELGKKTKARIEEMVEMTGLAKEAHKKISALSKGYKQRVGLAQAMLHDPEVLILDEPTSGLDPNQIVEIRDLITSIGKEKTVLLSTHIMQEVQAMCSRVIIINNGKIVANDSIDNLKQTAGKESLEDVFRSLTN